VTALFLGRSEAPAGAQFIAIFAPCFAMSARSSFSVSGCGRGG
jgi:hypothetical protein